MALLQLWQQCTHISASSSTLPADVRDRLTFEPYNFRQPQPVHGAEVYLLRMILHDWADADAALIIRNVVDALTAGRSRVLIMDTVLSKPGLAPVSAERIMRARDLTMMQAFNSKERDLQDWEELLAEADPRLVIRSVRQPYGSAMSILEVVLDG